MMTMLLLFCLMVLGFNGVTPLEQQLPQLDGRIVGGRDTTIDKFPWQVSLQSGRSQVSHFCGGSLYSKDIVITAAHCVFNLNPAKLKIRIGTSKHNEGGLFVNVTAIKTHERFNPFTMINDIAVLRLGAPVTLGRNVKTIKLANKAPPHNTKAAVTGWGATMHGDVMLPSHLQMVPVRMVSFEECASSAYGYGEFIRPSMICAYADGKDACQGDSGGPLVAGGRLVGVVSWGEGCAFPNYPGVYANVAYFHSWILKAIDTLMAA